MEAFLTYAPGIGSWFFSGSGGGWLPCGQVSWVVCCGRLFLAAAHIDIFPSSQWVEKLCFPKIREIIRRQTPRPMFVGSVAEFHKKSNVQPSPLLVGMFLLIFDLPLPVTLSNRLMDVMCYFVSIFRNHVLCDNNKECPDPLNLIASDNIWDSTCKRKEFYLSRKLVKLFDCLDGIFYNLNFQNEQQLFSLNWGEGFFTVLVSGC